MNKLKKYTVLVMAFLLLSCPVLSVSAAGITDGEEDKTYHYFIDGGGTRYNYYGKYFTFKVRAEVETTTLLAAYWDPASTSYGYDSYKIVCLSDEQVLAVGSVSAPRVVSYDVLENTGVADADSFFSIGSSVPAFSIGSWPYSSGSKYINTSSASTNIPYFVDMEAAEHFLRTGDLTGNQNPYDPMDDLEEDSTFALTGFSAVSEGKEGNVEAKWTGTTHDKNSSDYESMEYHVSATYTTGEGDTGHGGGGGSRDEEGNQETITGGKQTEANILSGDISEKGFKKLYSFFKPPSGTYHLYSLKVLPTYTVDGKMVKGKPSYIYFDSDGEITDIINENGDGVLSKDFYLLGVSSKKTIGGLLGYNISWTGTTRDSIISTLSIDDTLVDVFCSFTDSNGKKVFIDYHEVYPTFWDNGKPLRLRYKINDVSHGFQFSIDATKDYASMRNLVFTGDVYLTPSYTVSKSVTKGLTTIVDVVNGEVRYIDDFDPEDPGTPETPADPDNTVNPNRPLPETPSLDDDFDITDIFTYFLSILNWLKNSIGQLPELLAYLFPMLPSEFGYLITLGFLASIFCRILGR